MSERPRFVSRGYLQEEWHHISQTAEALGARGRARSRIADLAIARAAAESLELVPSVLRKPSSSVSRLQRALAAMAAFELPPLSPDPPIWRELQETAALAGEQVAATRALDEWSAASQGSDSARKGKGAYGTPRSLATEMVRKTLEPIARISGVPNVCDPSAGHGALLIAAYDWLVTEGLEPTEACALLHGVELDPHAWELCCLMVWLGWTRCKWCQIARRPQKDRSRERTPWRFHARSGTERTAVVAHSATG